MAHILLVIENLPEDSLNSPDDIALCFGVDDWIAVSNSNGLSEPKSSSPSAQNIKNALKVSATQDFLLSIFNAHSELRRIIRVSGLRYPLHRLLWHDIRDSFSEDKFDYILLTGEECGLDGFFLEVITKTAIESLLDQPLMPPGYLNGMVLPRSHRHWMSDSLYKYYVAEHFETLFPSPRWLAVNTIPVCNYKCIKCQYHSPLLGFDPKSYGAFMPIEKYRELLQICKSYPKLTSIAPTLSGEVLLHPNVVEMVQATKDAGYAIGFATNASLLTEQMSKKLIDAGVDGLAFSVDASTPETYRRLQGGDLVTVEKNILAFKEIWEKKRNSFSGTLVFVVSKDNEQEIDSFRNKWLQRGFSVMFSAQHDICNKNRPHFLHSEWGPSRRGCKVLWFGLYLTIEGQPLICGAHARPGRNPLQGNIFTDDPVLLWRAFSIGRIRENMLNRIMGPFCQEFSCWAAHYNTWIYKDRHLTVQNIGSWTEYSPSILAAKPVLVENAQIMEKKGLFRRMMKRILR